MAIFTFSHTEPYDEDRISLLWKMIRMVRELDDTPQIWKLTDPFLDAVSQFLHITEREQVLCVTFLDASIDITSQPPSLICVQATYPLDLVQSH